MGAEGWEGEGREWRGRGITYFCLLADRKLAKLKLARKYVTLYKDHNNNAM